MSEAPLSFPSAPADPAAQPATRWFLEDVQPHAAALRAYLRLRFPGLSDADDLVQEALARLWRMRDEGRPGSGKALLFTVARHLAVDRHRRSEASRIDFVADYDADMAAPGPDAAEAVCRRQEIEILREAIARLPRRCRQILTLRKIYGLSHREIATRLEIAERTVESQIGRGMRLCAKYLRRQGVTGEGGRP